MKKLLSILFSITALVLCVFTVSVAYADYQEVVVVQKADATTQNSGIKRNVYTNYDYYTGESYTDYYEESIPYPCELNIEQEEYVYDGTAKTPAVTIYDNWSDVIDATNYVVTYENNVEAGVGRVVVTFVGDYYIGEMSKDFIIRPTATTLNSVKYKSQGKILVKWKKQAGASGYVVQYSTSKKFVNDGHTCTVLVSGGNKTSKEIVGLANKTYYVRVTPYKSIGEYKYAGVFGNSKSVKVKKGASFKAMINATKTDMTGREAIKKLTKNGVDIKKYKTTYDRMRAIYTWHAKNNTKFVHCLACNANFNDCILELYGKNHCNDASVWIGCNYFKNSNGSKSEHKWSIIYISGVPYIFDPRIQGYGNYKGFDYFGIQTASSRAKQKYQFDDWYFCQTSYYTDNLM